MHLATHFGTQSQATAYMQHVVFFGSDPDGVARCEKYNSRYYNIMNVFCQCSVDILHRFDTVFTNAPSNYAGVCVLSIGGDTYGQITRTAL
jgi:hypothetical protein